MKVKEIIQMIEKVYLTIDQSIGFVEECTSNYEGKIEDFNELSVEIIYDENKVIKYNNVTSIEDAIMDKEAVLTEISIYSKNAIKYGTENEYSYIVDDSCNLTIELIK